MEENRYKYLVPVLRNLWQKLLEKKLTLSNLILNENPATTSQLIITWITNRQTK